MQRTITPQEVLDYIASVASKLSFDLCSKQVFTNAAEQALFDHHIQQLKLNCGEAIAILDAKR